MKPILYHIPFCPFSMAARVILYEKKIDFEPKECRGPELNVEGIDNRVVTDFPILINEQNNKFYSFWSIVGYIRTKHDNAYLYCGNEENCALNSRITSIVAGIIFGECYTPAFNEKFLKFMQNRSLPNKNILEKCASTTLFYFDRIETICKKEEWLIESNIVLADILLATNVACLDYLGIIPWKKVSPFIKEWYVRFKSRPSFSKLLKERLPSVPPATFYSVLDF